MEKKIVERIMFIIDSIISSPNHSVSTEKIREYSKCSERQVRRDIDCLKSCGINIEYSHAKKGYTFDIKSEKQNLPLLNNLNLCLAIFHQFLYSKTIGQVNLLPFEEKFFEIIFANRNAYDFAKYFQFDNSGVDIVKPEIFKICLQALRGKKRLTFEYSDLKGKKSKKEVSPLQFYHYLNNWYLIAYDCLVGQIRQYKLSRISFPKVSDNSASELVSEKELEDYINGSFGMYKGRDGLKSVKVRFYGRAKQIVFRQKWHPNQKTSEGKSSQGKYFQLEFPVFSYEEITGRVLSYAPYAEAVAPKDFRRYWRKCLEKTLEKFFPRSKSNDAEKNCKKSENDGC